jgi:hypothetical protein
MKTREEMLAANRDRVMPPLLSAIEKNDVAEETKLIETIMADSFDHVARAWLALDPPKQLQKKFLAAATGGERKILETEKALACIDRLQRRLLEAQKAKKAAATAIPNA